MTQAMLVVPLHPAKRKYTPMPAGTQDRQKRKGLAATRTRGLSQAMLGFYPKRAGELLDGVTGVVRMNRLTIIPLDHKTY
jgi:hypothetical protein